MIIEKLSESLLKNEKEKSETTDKGVFEIPIKNIEDFPNHPFKIEMNEEMMEMVDSIKQYGVLVPTIVRLKQNGNYEMISGHRRKYASELAGLEILPCIVRNLSKNEAIIVMVDSNLQREKILPSEKAFAYKMKLDAIKMQGKRIDLTSAPTAQKFVSRKKVGECVRESQDQVRRFIRLTNLVPKILDMVDEGKMALRPAVEISYLTQEQQNNLYDSMEFEDCTPSHAQTIKMRKFAEKGELTEEIIQSILREEKSNQKEQFRIPQERISKYFAPGTSKENMQDTIVKALEYYRKWQQSVKLDGI